MEPSTVPSPITCAKSRTRRRKRLAMRGVPRERRAISAAPSGVMGVASRPAELVTMTASSSGVYSSSRNSIPNRSRSGEESCPDRVVAPMSVKGCSGMRIERADGPLPIIRSSAKSSIAGYRTSSTARGRRWISSMNSTSLRLSVVSSAARSPAFSMAGPEVIFRFTPSSDAMMQDSVVLPSPGGP